jgi:hypothetical protein
MRGVSESSVRCPLLDALGGKALLFGVTPLALGAFIGVSLIFVGVAAMASCMPARYASNVDPMVLRAE